MSEHPDVRVGDVWEDCDKRQRGRRVRVRSVDHLFGVAHLVNVRTGRESKALLSRFRPIATGYRLVQRCSRD